MAIQGTFFSEASNQQTTVELVICASTDYEKADEAIGLRVLVKDIALHTQVSGLQAAALVRAGELIGAELRRLGR